VIRVQRLLLPLLLLVVGTAGNSYAQQVTIDVHNHSEHAVSCAVRLEPSATDSESVAFSLSAPGTRSVELPPGDPWTVEVTADGRWPDSAVVVPRAGIPEHASIDLWPVGTLTATIAVEADESVPSSIRVRFSGPHGVPPTPGFPEDEVTCPVEETQMRCTLPAGNLDLRVRARGMISHYRWNQAVPADATTDLGTLKLRRGASVTGWVVAAEGQPDLSACTLELRQLGPDPDTSLSRQARQRSTADARGFFHITGVAPGLYTLEARLPKLGSARFMPLAVMENAESALAEPMVLRPPATLEIEVEPPADPWSRPWQVTARERAMASSITIPVNDIADLGSGRWRCTGLERGTYLIRVGDLDGNGWWREEVQVGSASSTTHIEMPIVAVEGLVHSGDDPVQGVVFMGGLRGDPRIRMVTEDDGTFSGYLPRVGRWTITVAAGNGRMQRTFTRMPLDASDDGTVWVDLEIAATSITGIVVDDRDQPVAQASVILTRHNSPDLRPTIRTGDDGRFQIDGIPEGPAVIEASANDLRSDPLPLDISSETPADVRIILRAMKVITGRVFSNAGGVPGATVDAVPIGATVGSAIPTEQTEVDGSFELRVPPSTGHLHLQVMAPGFAMQFFLADVNAEATLSIPLDQQSGRLVIDGEAANAAGRVPVILHRGSFVTAPQLWQWLRMNGRSYPSGSRMDVPAVEPGDYVYCEVTPDQLAALIAGLMPTDSCSVPQLLVAGGELVLGESADG